MDAEPSLTSSVASIRGLFGAAACSVALVDPAGGSLAYVAADGEGAQRIVGVELPVGRGIGGWAVMAGQPLAVRDVAADARFARDVAEATQYVPSAMLVAPMFGSDGEALGVVSVLDPAVDVAADWGLAVLGTLATQVALLVEANGARSPGEDAALADLGRRVVALVDERRP